MRYRPRDRIGDRYLVHQAFEGGMGEVYLCLDLQANGPVALKTVQSHYLADPARRAAFNEEVEHWVALGSHANIVRCFYLNTIDNLPFMILEWVAGDERHGVTLREWLLRMRGPFPPLIAQFGGFPIRRQRDAVICDQRPPMAYTRGTELIKRLLADVCERCGSTTQVEVHHIRKLADLRRPGQGNVPDWRRIMATRKRKTLVVCRRCHEDIHTGKANRQPVPA